MNCRSQERSEDGLGRSGRCRLVCLPAWHGNRRRCGWWSCDVSTTFAPFPSAAAVRPASAHPVDVRLAACGDVVCVADSGDGLP